MSLLDKVKDIADIVQKAGNLDLYRRVCDLEGEVITVTRENRRLQAANEELEGRLALKARLTFMSPLYYAEGDPVPFCPRCWEVDQKLVHLPPAHFNDMADTLYGCLGCGTRFSIPHYVMKHHKRP